MKTLILTVAALLALCTVAEAGLFHRRDGSKRQPVKNTLKAVGGCVGGSCRR